MGDTPERADMPATPADAGVETPPPSELTQLQAELVQARAAQSELQDRLLRARAEIENTRKRAETGMANAHKYAIERFAGEVIGVRDGLELARTVDLDQGNATAVQKMHEGLELTLKLMDDVFRKFGVTLLDPKGEKFDPNRHHAISLVESDEIPPQHVVTVMQKGYLLHDRVLRPAMVVVAKSKSTELPGQNT